MELREYWEIVRRRWWVPVVLALGALVLSSMVALRGANAFRTEMRLAISTLPTVPPESALYYDPVYYANLSSEYLADDLSEILTSEAFAQDVSRELGFAITPAAIADVTRTTKTHRLIDVSIITPTREEGGAIGEAIVRIVNDPERVSGYLQAMDAYNASVSIVNRPVTMRSSSLSGIAIEVGLRTLVGLMLGLGLAFLFHYLDPTVRSRSELQRELGLPVLAEIPRTGKGVPA